LVRCERELFQKSRVNKYSEKKADALTSVLLEDEL
jgi:hypothetical protein